MISKLDGWLARRTFWPIIIKVCQEVGCTKWAFGRTCSFLWCCGFILTVKTWDWFTIALVALVAIAETISLGALKDFPYSGSGVWRSLWWGIFIIECLGLTVGLDGAQWLRVASVLAMLFSVYAAALPTVPPKRRKERKASRKVTA